MFEYLDYDDISVPSTSEGTFSPPTRFNDVSHLQDIEETENLGKSLTDQNAIKPRKWYEHMSLMEADSAGTEEYLV